MYIHGPQSVLELRLHLKDRFAIRKIGRKCRDESLEGEGHNAKGMVKTALYLSKRYVLSNRLPYMLAMCSYKILGDAVVSILYFLCNLTEAYQSFLTFNTNKDASRSKKILRLLKVSAALTPQTLDRNSEIIVLEPQYKLLSV